MPSREHLEMDGFMEGSTWTFTSRAAGRACAGRSLRWPSGMFAGLEWVQLAVGVCMSDAFLCIFTSSLCSFLISRGGK